jgi:hypothetical protein
LNGGQGAMKFSMIINNGNQHNINFFTLELKKLKKMNGLKRRIRGVYNGSAAQICKLMQCSSKKKYKKLIISHNAHQPADLQKNKKR